MFMCLCWFICMIRCMLCARARRRRWVFNPTNTMSLNGILKHITYVHLKQVKHGFFTHGGRLDIGAVLEGPNELIQGGWLEAFEMFVEDVEQGTVR